LVLNILSVTSFVTQSITVGDPLRSYAAHAHEVTLQIRSRTEYFITTCNITACFLTLKIEAEANLIGRF